jgi:hypothetical protein
MKGLERWLLTRPIIVYQQHQENKAEIIPCHDLFMDMRIMQSFQNEERIVQYPRWSSILPDNEYSPVSVLAQNLCTTK